MQKRPYILVILVVLLLQPIIVGTAMPSLMAPAQTPKSVAQGFRVDPLELIDHVPVFINGTDDFVSQGWQGAGTQANPYVISALNITRDVSYPLITILNTNAYFVLRDCYLKQLSVDNDIYIENTTHARLEFLTLETATNGGGGIVFGNANHTVVDHVEVKAYLNQALYLSHSHECQITNNYLYSVVLTGFAAEYCESITLTTNSITTEIVGNPCMRLAHSNYAAISNLNAKGGSYTLYMFDSNHTSLSGAYLETYQQGLWYYSCIDATIDNLEINGTLGGEGATFESMADLTINGLTIYDTITTGLDIISCNDTLVSNLAMSNTIDRTVYLTQSSNVNITNAHIRNGDGHGIQIDTLTRGLIDNADIEAQYNQGVHIESSEHIILSRLKIADTGGAAIYIENNVNYGLIEWCTIDVGIKLGILIRGDNWTVQDNLIVSAYRGIQFESGGVGAWVYRNTVEYADAMGIQVERNDAEIINNTVMSGASGLSYGIYVQASRAFIDGNTVSGTYRGITLRNYPNGTIIHNSVTNIEYIGFDVSSTDNLVFEDNMLSNTEYLGVHISGVANGSFKHNHLINSGFIFETDNLYSDLHPIFLDNTVNSKPVFFGYESNNLVLNGNDYGEIILVNCSNSVIQDGTFSNIDGGFQVWYSDHVEISGVTLVSNKVGNVIEQSSNVTIRDGIVQGSNGWNVFAALYCENIIVDNVDFTDIRGSSSTIFGYYSDNLSIIDCNFENNNWPIRILGSNYYNITGCLMRNSDVYAIYTGSTSNNGLISSCSIDNATYGIWLSDSAYTVIKEVTILHAGQGIYGTGLSQHVNVTLCRIEDGGIGISTSGSSQYWFILNNTIRWNSNTGIKLSSNLGVEVYYNIIALNALNGNDNQGDYWDDGVSTGNAWNDYSPPGVYNVGGSGGAQDRYPMQYMVTVPIINQPSDVYYGEGSLGNSITWLPFDNELRDWAVNVDGVMWRRGAWNYKNVTVNIDGLAYGTHTAIITVWDVDQNSVQDTVIIHVYDNTAPVISNVANTWAFVDGTGQALSWQVSDLHPGTYVVYVDNEIWTSGTWTSGTLDVSIDGLSEGEHSLLTVISDLDGNTASDSVTIKVIKDTVAPTIDSPPDMTYRYGETGNSIVWTPADEYPSLFSVTLNGSVYVGGPWGGSKIIVNVDGLSMGPHVFSVTVSDGSGNTATDSVTVTVLAATGEVTLPPPLDIGLVLLVVGVAAAVVVVLVVFILYRRRGAI